jgi:hypothetical protein
MPIKQPAGAMPYSAADPLPSPFFSLKGAANSAAGRPAIMVSKPLTYKGFSTSRGHISCTEAGFFPDLREERTR